MITPAEKVAITKRIRALECEYFPDYSEQILGTKSVEAIINTGINQKTLSKEGWLEKQVKNKCENHILNAAHGNDKQLKKLAAKIKAAKEPSKQTYEPPRALQAKEASHYIKFTFSEMPDYQEQEEYYRLAFLALGFAFEVHLDKKSWRNFLGEVARCKGRWEATLAGRIESETAQGFMLSSPKLSYELRRAKTGS